MPVVTYRFQIFHTIIFTVFYCFWTISPVGWCLPHPGGTIWGSVQKVTSVLNRTLTRQPCPRGSRCCARCATLCMLCSGCLPWLLYYVLCALCPMLCFLCVLCCARVCLCLCGCVCVCFLLFCRHFGKLFGIICQKVKVYAGHLRCHFLDFFGTSML